MCMPCFAGALALFCLLVLCLAAPELAVPWPCCPTELEALLMEDSCCAVFCSAFEVASLLAVLGNLPATFLLFPLFSVFFLLRASS